MKELFDILCVIPQARLGVQKDTLIGEAHENSLRLFKIFLRRHLCSKKLMLEDRLDTQAFDVLTLKIRETFGSAIVFPGEMVGSIGA